MTAPTEIVEGQGFAYTPHLDDDATRYLCRGSGCGSWSVGYTLYTDGTLVVQRYQCKEHLPRCAGGQP